jgi:hypothetical protein
MIYIYFLVKRWWWNIRNVEICRPRRVGAEELHALLWDLEKVIYGAESIPLKNKVQECKQLVGESMTTFSHRLMEKAEIAFSNQQWKDENCVLALLRGVRDKEIRRKLNESSVTTFGEALKLAKKLDKISNMFEVEYNPT